jgi:hypothetical protein
MGNHFKFIEMKNEQRYCFFSAIESCVHKAAEQSVQPTGGIRPDLQAFFSLRAFSCSPAESTPAHQRLTQTVGWLR